MSAEIQALPQYVHQLFHLHREEEKCVIENIHLGEPRYQKQEYPYPWDPKQTSLLHNFPTILDTYHHECFHYLKLLCMQFHKFVLHNFLHGMKIETRNDMKENCKHYLHLCFGYIEIDNLSLLVLPLDHKTTPNYNHL